MPRENEVITVREFYAIFDEKMREVNTNIHRVEEKFDKLEDGKIATLEKEISDLKSKQANMEGRAMMIPTIVSIGLGAFFTIINFVLSRLK